MELSIYTSEGLKKGSVNQFDIPIFFAESNVTTDLNVSTPVAINIDQAAILTDSSIYSHSTLLNPSRITFSEAGRYAIWSNSKLDYSAGTASNDLHVQLKVRKNDGLASAEDLPGRGVSGVMNRTTGANVSSVSVFSAIDASAGDFIEVFGEGVGDAVDSEAVNTDGFTILIQRMSD